MNWSVLVKLLLKILPLIYAKKCVLNSTNSMIIVDHHTMAPGAKNHQLLNQEDHLPKTR